MLLRLSCVIFAAALLSCSKQSRLQDSFSAKTGDFDLPAGEITLSAPLVVEDAHDLTIRGDGTRLRVQFEGPAAIIIRKSRNVRLENISLEGHRTQSDHRFGLPPSNQSMARWNQNNGVLVEDSTSIHLSKFTIRNIVSYAILVSKSTRTVLDEIFVGDSGSLDAKGQNNATGGILFEEGCEKFSVTRSKLRNIRGNGIWTHSLATSPRNKEGEFVRNDIRYIGRDALQAGHAIQLRIEGNTGGFIGYPIEIVDLEHAAVPVVLDTAGNVETSVYLSNAFEEVNGKCIDLDGFHHGLVKNNECINRREASAYPSGHFGIVFNNSNPEMQSRNVEIVANHVSGFRFGGLFLIGSGHTVQANRFLNLNLAHCNDNVAAGCLYKAGEPDLLRSGIYLGLGAERPDPAKGNRIEGNTIQGYGMRKWCIGAAPGIAREANTVAGNTCL